MQAFLWLLVVFVSLCTAMPVAAQARVGALAIDERQGDQWGWAVDFETVAAAQAHALSECGPGCSVVLTFGRCAAYAADQDADSTAVGWAEAYASAPAAQQAARSECRSRGGGSGCIVRAWGCNSPVVEERLNLDRAARRQIQRGLQVFVAQRVVAQQLRLVLRKGKQGRPLSAGQNGSPSHALSGGEPLSRPHLPACATTGRDGSGLAQQPPTPAEHVFNLSVGFRPSRKQPEQGRRACPAHVDEALAAPVPMRCPDCGGNERRRLWGSPVGCTFTRLGRGNNHAGMDRFHRPHRGLRWNDRLATARYGRASGTLGEAGGCRRRNC